MYYFKKFIINNYPDSDLYCELVIDNCLNDINTDSDNNLSAKELVFKDYELTDIVYNMILYGNMKSRTDKKLSLHSRIHSYDEDDKHQISIEIEKYQRFQFYIHNVMILFFIGSIVSGFYILIK